MKQLSSILITGIALTGLSGAFNSCVPPTETNTHNSTNNQRLTQAQTQVIAGRTIDYFVKDPKLKLAAQLLVENGLMKQQLDVAEVGRSNTTINNTGSNIPSNRTRSLFELQRRVIAVGEGVYVPEKGLFWDGKSNQNGPRYYVDVLNAFLTPNTFVDFANFSNSLPPQGIFTFNKYVELDGNSGAVKDELFGLNKSNTFNLTDNSFGFGFMSYKPDTTTFMKMGIYDLEEHEIWINKFKAKGDSYYLRAFQTSKDNWDIDGGLLDSLLAYGSGTRRIVVIDSKGKINTKDIEIKTQ